MIESFADFADFFVELFLFGCFADYAIGEVDADSGGTAVAVPSICAEVDWLVAVENGGFGQVSGLLFGVVSRLFVEISPVLGLAGE